MRTTGFVSLAFTGDVFEASFVEGLLRDLPFTRVRVRNTDEGHQVLATISIEDYEIIKTKVEQWKSRAL